MLEDVGCPGDVWQYDPFRIRHVASLFSSAVHGAYAVG